MHHFVLKMVTIKLTSNFQQFETGVRSGRIKSVVRLHLSSLVRLYLSSSLPLNVQSDLIEMAWAHCHRLFEKEKWPIQ